jgi:hypothetical protein
MQRTDEIVPDFMPQSVHETSNAVQFPTAEAGDGPGEDSHATEEDDDDSNDTYSDPTVIGVDGRFILDVKGPACDKWRISELEQLEALERLEVLNQLEEEDKAKAFETKHQEHLETGDHGRWRRGFAGWRHAHT